MAELVRPRGGMTVKYSKYRRSHDCSTRILRPSGSSFLVHRWQFRSLARDKLTFVKAMQNVNIGSTLALQLVQRKVPESQPGYGKGTDSDITRALRRFWNV